MSQHSKEAFDVIVIGGGASGLMAAGRAAEKGKRVLLLEKNKRIGEKLRITGGGRCNITNAEHDLPTLLSFYGKAEPYLYSLFSQFGVASTITFFESRGLPLVEQGKSRMFPKTEKASDVVHVLGEYVAKGKVVLACDEPVVRMLYADNKITQLVTKKGIYTGQSYILATGGSSHQETGSTGDGFEWLRQAGHAIHEPTPSIVPIMASDAWIHSLAGVSVQNAKITFFVDGKKQFSNLGRILFTHFGLSGPLILNNAARVGDLLHEGIVTAAIDIDPKNDIGAVERSIIKAFDEHKNKALKNCIAEFVPEGLAKGVVTLVEKKLDLETKVHSVTKPNRRILAETIKAMPVTVEGLMGFDKAVVADGGVSLDDVDTKTMRSKKVDNLFITGDLLHINRPSGGFSLQLCWSSGYVAGDSA